MPKPRLYLETTIPSYLTAWTSRDPEIAADQQTTKDWWQNRRQEFEVYISEFVWKECSGGDSAAAKERLTVLEGVPLLDELPEIDELAAAFMSSGALPERAATDALHIAFGAVHEMDYLLTWNCKHIANGEIIKVVRQICHMRGFSFPDILTPTQLMGIEK